MAQTGQGLFVCARAPSGSHAVPAQYDVRKNFADSRLRVKGRFVRKEDEQLLRELIAMV